MKGLVRWGQNDAWPWPGQSFSKNRTYIIKDWLQTETDLTLIQINRLCHGLAVPFNTGFELLELTPKLFSHSIFMCLLIVWAIFSLSLQTGVCLVVSERFIWLLKVGNEDRLFPQWWISCLFPTLFYPRSKCLKGYVVMPLLSTNLRLIKHVAFSIHIFEPEGNVLCLKSWGRCFFFNLCQYCILLSAPNGQCILCSDKRLITHSFSDTY